MKAAALLVLAACGDNTSLGFGLDAAYDDRAPARYFGIVQSYGPAPARTIAMLDGAQVCIDDTCVTSANGGQFVLVAGKRGVESTLAISAPDFMTTIVPVVGGVAGDRNLGPIPIISPELQAQTAMVFGIDPMTDSRGTALISVARYDTGAMGVAIDGLRAYYIGATGLPAPTATELTPSNAAVFYGLDPAVESIVHGTGAHCDAGESGWTGANPGEIRIPAAAGEITFAQPFCYAQ